jgi:hypothetical protein
MTVQDIMDRVSTLYNDTSFARVSQTMYLKFLDDSLSQLVLARPDAHYKISNVLLSAGTKQTVPADCITLMDIYRNRGADGTSNGAPVWQVNRKDLDYFSNWHGDPTTVTTEITEFAYDSKFPNTYWVSPPPVLAQPVYVEMAYSYPFTSYAAMGWTSAVGQTIDTQETFKNPICAYMLYLLYSTDSSSKYDKDVAEKYRTDFYNALGLEMKAGSLNAPTPGEVTVTQTATSGGSK